MAGDTPLVIRVAANLDELRKNMADGAGVIDVTSQALTRMSSSYDGSKIIQQANATAAAIQQIGGVTNLTAAEQAKANTILDAALEKYALLGKTAPAGMQALADATKQIPAPAQEATSAFGSMLEGAVALASALGLAFSVQSILAFASSAVEGAAKLEDLSRATGISTDGLQQLAYVAAESGIGVDQLTRGVEQLSAKLAGGDKNATTAVELMGLSVKDLLAAGPQEAFLEIAEAVGRIDDPMTKNAIATDLWGGRLAKQLIPALHDMRTEMAAVPTGALISDVNIQKAHDFEVGLDHLETQLKSWTVTALGAAFTWEHFGISTKQATAAASDFVGPMDQVTNGVTSADAATIHLTQTVKDKIAADQLAAEQSKTFQAALVEVSSAGTSWQTTLDTIDGSILDNMRDLTAAGVSIKTLETYYGLTATQGKAFSDMLKDEATALKTNAAQYAEVQKASDQYYKAVNAASHDTVGRQIDDAYLAANAQIAAMEKSKTYSVEAELLIWKAAEQTANNIVQKTLESDPYTQEHYQLVADQARIAYDFALDHASSYTHQEIQLLHDAYVTDEQASNHWAATASADMDKVAASADPVVAKLNAIAAAEKQAQDAADAAAKSEQKVLDAMKSSVDVTAQNFQDMLQAATQSSYFTLNGMVDVGGERGGMVTKSNADGSPGPAITAEEAASEGYSFQEIVAALKGAPLGAHPGGPRIPGFAGGVDNFGGGLAVVGEQGPEMVRLPPGSSVYPHGASGGSGTSVTIAAGAIVLNFPIMNDPRAKQELASLVGDAILTKLRSQGLRVPSGA